MITRQDIAAQLEDRVRVGFLTGANQYTPRRGAFVQETSSDGAFETYADFGSVPWPGGVPSGGLTGAQGVDTRTGAQIVGGLLDGGNVTFYGGAERSLIVYNNDWPVGIAISHNAINDNRVGNLEGWATSLGTRFEQHKDFLCFDALNKGHLASSPYGVGFDGQPLFSDSHVYPNASYTTAQGNKFTLPLSVDNFKTVRIAGSKLNDDRGQPLGNDHRTIVASSTLEYELFQITQNVEVSGTANRDANPYAASGTQGVLAPGGYLDDGAWFAVDSSLPQKPIILQIRQEPSLEIVDWYLNSVPTRYYLWVARYSVAYGTWSLALKGN